MVVIIGYINVFWIFKVDLVSEYFCCLFKYMDKKGLIFCLLIFFEENIKIEFVLDLVFGYI